MAYLEMPKKTGKALAIDTPIPTPDGWKTMGQLGVGDRLFDEKGEVCNVICESEVFTDHDCYRVEFSNGERWIIADGGHRWLTSAIASSPGDRKKKARLRQPVMSDGGQYSDANVYGTQVHPGRANEPDTARRLAVVAAEDIEKESIRAGARRIGVRSTEQIFRNQRAGHACNHSIAMPSPLRLPEAELPVEPYVLGVWLGDGTSSWAGITCGDLDMDEIASQITAYGYSVSEKRDDSVSDSRNKGN